MQTNNLSTQLINSQHHISPLLRQWNQVIGVSHRVRVLRSPLVFGKVPGCAGGTAFLRSSTGSAGGPPSTWPNRFPQSSETSGVANNDIKKMVGKNTVVTTWLSSTHVKTDLHCPRVADQIAGQLQHLEVYDVRCFLWRRTGLLIRAAKGPQSKEPWSTRQRGKKDHIKVKTSEVGNYLLSVSIKKGH